MSIVCKKRVARTRLWVPLLALLLAGASARAASDLDREMLESMRRRGDITQERYEELKAQLEKDAASDWKFSWSNGFKLDSADGSFQTKFGGRIFNDWFVQRVDGSAESDLGAENQTGTKFRAARLFVEGMLYDRAIFKAEYDFADSNGDAEFKDVYLGLQDLPLGATGRVGHYKEFFSLEQLTSSRFITFLERSLADTFAPGRNTGLGFNGTCGEDCFTWGIGVFAESDDFGDGFGNDQNYDLTMRFTGVPYADEQNRRLLHLGTSYSHQFRHGDQPLSYDARPGLSEGAQFVDTGDIPAKNVDLVGHELAWLCGPWSLQSEFIHSYVDQNNGSNLSFWGVYGEVSYFLTGEQRTYKRETGTFDRLKPNHNLNPSEGHWGAWQLAARIDHIDLDSKNVAGGKLTDYTGGLNWYPYPNFRVMANYVYGRTDYGPKSNVAEMRFQVDF